MLSSEHEVEQYCQKDPIIKEYYTIMDFSLSKYSLIFTEFDSIDLGS